MRAKQKGLPDADDEPATSYGKVQGVNRAPPRRPRHVHNQKWHCQANHTRPDPGGRPADDSPYNSSLQEPDAGSHAETNQDLGAADTDGFANQSQHDNDG